MYVLPVISANSSLAHDSIYIDKTGGKIILYDMPANTATGWNPGRVKVAEGFHPNFHGQRFPNQNDFKSVSKLKLELPDVCSSIS